MTKCCCQKPYVDVIPAGCNKCDTFKCRQSYEDGYKPCYKPKSKKFCSGYRNGYYGYPIENGTSGYEKYIFGYGCCEGGFGPNYGRGCGYCNNNYGKAFYGSGYYGSFGSGYDCGSRKVGIINGTPQIPNYVYN